MAYLYVEQWKGVGVQAGLGTVPVPSGLIDTHRLAVATASNQSTAFSTGLAMIAIVTDVACQYETGDNPTVSDTSRYLPAGGSRFIPASPGQKIAVALKRA